MNRQERAAAYHASIVEALRILRDRADQDLRLASCEELYDLAERLTEQADIDMPVVS